MIHNKTQITVSHSPREEHALNIQIAGFNKYQYQFYSCPQRDLQHSEYKLMTNKQN